MTLWREGGKLFKMFQYRDNLQLWVILTQDDSVQVDVGENALINGGHVTLNKENICIAAWVDMSVNLKKCKTDLQPLSGANASILSSTPARKHYTSLGPEPIWQNNVW